MPDFKEITKGGWHPKGKDGKSKESWRGDFKGIAQVSSWLGKGDQNSSNTTEASEHISRPLSSLKDPAAFGPPPKHIHFHGGAALPNQITPDRRGLGAPLSQEEIQANKRRADEEEQRRIAEEEERTKPKPPPAPFRADTTGLSTSHLPPPPVRRDIADRPRPSPAAKPKPPSLPPRLPPRQNSSTIASPPSTSGAATPEPDAHKGILNQASLNRLGAAGVSVPELGIGGASTPTPPPRSPVPSHSSGPNASQLDELQSRFSRLNSSGSPAKETPSEGTSFAQKQAAFKTVSSFRNDPSSVSFSDARNAASTANNFRERHGDQVKSGWQSANKFNDKYGITNKVGCYAGIGAQQPSEPASPMIEMRDNTSEGQSSIVGKKKPPPPPVKRAELSASGVSKDTGPPPIPMASKPKFQPSSPEVQVQDLDLDLKSEWFAKSPPAFPPASIIRLPGTRSYASTSGWSSTGVRKIHTFTGAIRDNGTLATTIIHLTWDSSNPGLTVKAQQRHLPPPRKLTRSELESYREQYSDAIARWSESKMAQQVGDGECWTLANEALLAVAANCSSRGEEPCMPSQSLVHGFLIYSYIPSVSPHPEPRGGTLEAGVARGDILQLRTAHFKAKDGMSEKWAGAPDHTAVVVGVEPNGAVRVVEQNVGGVKRVREGSYDMSELVRGEARIFRAVGESWAGKLEPRW